MCIAVVALSGVLVPTPSSEAQAALMGGRALNIIYCECEPCNLITLGGPRGGDFMYCPAMYRMYEHYRPYPTAWQLGVAWGYKECHLIICGQDGGSSDDDDDDDDDDEVCSCEVVGAGPIVDFFGTSLY